MRLVVMIALAGCDLVIGIDHLDPASGPCGPYAAPARVMFDPGLGAPTDLSVAADGMHGLVFATYNNTMGPTPVIFDGAMWMPDTARFDTGKLAMNLTGGHIDVTGATVFGWIDHRYTTLPVIVEYGYTTKWTAVNSNLDSRGEDFDLFTGQEVASEAGGSGTSRYLVEIFEPVATITPHKIEIAAAGPAAPDVFKPSGFVDPLNADMSIDVIGGALTGDHKVLVYAASEHDTNEYHLYATTLGHNEFQVGDAIGSLEIGGKSDDQPWVNADCSTIWFRRDGVTWTA